MEYREVRCKAFEGWNMSASMLFGKSPKIKIICGKCSNYFSQRFDMNALGKSNPRTVCPFCGTVNKIPIVLE